MYVYLFIHKLYASSSPLINYIYYKTDTKTEMKQEKDEAKYFKNKKCSVLYLLNIHRFFCVLTKKKIIVSGKKYEDIYIQMEKNVHRRLRLVNHDTHFSILNLLRQRFLLKISQ